MTPAEYDKRTGAEKLRMIVGAMDHCSESFLDRFSALQLMAIHRAWALSEWDFFPDQWAPRQVTEALIDGRPPTWDDNERPTYDREETADERSDADLAESTE